METLFTPWRSAYLTGGRRERGCIFCRARDAGDDASHLIVHRGRLNFLILNRYPYNNGHLMIVPNRHIPSLSGATPAQLGEMMQLTARAERVLQRIYRMDGLNLGMNLGSSAGAGVIGHLHLHVVPRWQGDTNFMSVVGGTRITPETLLDSYRRIRAGFAGAMDRPRNRSPRRARAKGVR